MTVLNINNSTSVNPSEEIDLEIQIQNLSERINNLEQHSLYKAKEKAWEESYLRTLALAIVTYGTTLGIFYLIKAESPYLAAIIPTTGYLLSRPSIWGIKQLWEKFIYNKEEDPYLAKMV